MINKRQTKKTSRLSYLELRCGNKLAAFPKVKAESHDCRTNKRCNLKLSQKALMTLYILANPVSIKAKIISLLIWAGLNAKYFRKKTRALLLLK